MFSVECLSATPNSEIGFSSISRFQTAFSFCSVWRAGSLIPPHEIHPRIHAHRIAVVIAIIGILAALLLPALSSPNSARGRPNACPMWRQIGLGMRMFADDANGLYPISGGVILWDQTDPDTRAASWLQQIVSYTQNTNVYHCPTDRQTAYSYFNSGRAAYVITNGNAAVNSRLVQFPSAHVLAGDTTSMNLDHSLGMFFQPDDADKDDYTQDCVGGDEKRKPGGGMAHSR